MLTLTSVTNIHPSNQEARGREGEYVCVCLCLCLGLGLCRCSSLFDKERRLERLTPHAHNTSARPTWRVSDDEGQVGCLDCLEARHATAPEARHLTVADLHSIAVVWRFQPRLLHTRGNHGIGACRCGGTHTRTHICIHAECLSQSLSFCVM